MARDADPLIPHVHWRRRLKRRLLHLLTAVSLMLCIATAALWVRSYFVSDRLFRQFVRETDARDDWAQEALHCGRGRVGVARVVQPVYWAPEDRHGQRATRGIPFHSVGPPQDPDFNFQPAVRSLLGFRVRRYTSPVGATHRSLFELVFPLWFPFLAFLALPAFRAWRWRKSRMLRLPGRCRCCGYDVRATPDICPECGTAVATGAACEAPRSARTSSER